MRPFALLVVAAAAAVSSPARAEGLADLVGACRAAMFDDEHHEAAYARILTVRLDDASLGALTVQPVGGGQQLVIDFARDLTGQDKLFTLDGGGDRATATLPAATAGALLKARERGQLVGRVAFRFREAEREGGQTASVIDQACVLARGGVRARATPLWVDLAAPGSAPVRLLTPRGAAEPQPGSPREVRLSGVGRDGEGVARDATPLRDRAFSCFRDRPGGGRMVLELEIASGGSVSQARAIVDGVRDDTLRACVLQAARGLSVGGGRRRVELTLDFQIGPPR